MSDQFGVKSQIKNMLPRDNNFAMVHTDTLFFSVTNHIQVFPTDVVKSMGK